MNNIKLWYKKTNTYLKLYITDYIKLKNNSSSKTDKKNRSIIHRKFNSNFEICITVSSSSEYPSLILMAKLILDKFAHNVK